MFNANARVLILTANFGDGHLQVSRVLSKYFCGQGTAQVRTIDLMREAHPVLNSISRKLYLASAVSSQYGLDYYGWSYYATRGNNPTGSVSKCYNFLGKKKLRETIRGWRPDVIVNTFPFGASFDIGREFSIPVCTVITDYAIHARWLHPDTHRYYVAAAEMKDELINKGFSEESRVQVTGIPLRPVFEQISSSGESPILPQRNSSKPLILLSAGSYGVLGSIEETVNLLMRAGDCQVAVVCGRNRKLELSLLRSFAGHQDVFIFGFVEAIHELMACASCIVTKAGGITLSEALSLRLPVFVFRPFGGQERENALFFNKKGVACISNHADELFVQMRRFLASPMVSMRMKKRMAALNQGSATERVAEDILRIIGRRKTATV